VSAEDLPPEVLAPVRAACLALPETYEEPAWIGARWLVRRRTFAHLLPVEAGRSPAFTRAVGSDAPAIVLTFRSASPELEVLRSMGSPFFPVPWGPDVVGMVLVDGTDRAVDWTEVAELLTESYRVRAPRKLREAMDRTLPDG
jgi:hypothetical protein